MKVPDDFQLSKDSIAREFFDCGYDGCTASQKVLIDCRFEQLSQHKSEAPAPEERTPDFQHDEDCCCYGDTVEHSKDCKNCECQPPDPSPTPWDFSTWGFYCDHCKTFFDLQTQGRVDLDNKHNSTIWHRACETSARYIGYNPSTPECKHVFSKQSGCCLRCGDAELHESTPPRVTQPWVTHDDYRSSCCDSPVSVGDDDVCVKCGNPCSWLASSPSVEPAPTKCPKCGGEIISSAHGYYCPKTSCKWGWEVEMDGSPLRGPSVEESRDVDALNILVGACGILDVIKGEWGESWSEFDQSIRDGLSNMLKRGYAWQAGAASRGETGWISTKHRFPDYDEDVIVVIGGAVQNMLAHLEEETESWRWSDPDGDTAPKEAVTHWQALPAAPKEEK